MASPIHQGRRGIRWVPRKATKTLVPSKSTRLDELNALKASIDRLLTVTKYHRDDDDVLAHELTIGQVRALGMVLVERIMKEEERAKEAAA